MILPVVVFSGFQDDDTLKKDLHKLSIFKG